MDDNTKNTQTSSQQDGQQEQAGAGQQEKLFTQADVDRIINARIARMKQDTETADTYRRERDDARRELEQYKNDAFLTSKGVIDRDYVTFKATQLMDDKTNFQQAAEKFLKENPRFMGRGFKVSTGTPDGGTGRSGVLDADIRKAMGLKG